MIGAGAVIAAGEAVVAVGAQRHPIGAGMPGPARIGDLLGRQPVRGAACRPVLLPRRGPVLVGVGVAARPIQGPLTRPRPLAARAAACCCSSVQRDLLDNQLLGMPGGEGGQRQVGHVGIHTRAPTGGDLGATRPGGRGLVAGLMGQQMGVVAPAAGCFAVPDPHQVDLVPHGWVGQEMAQVRPLARPLG